MRVREVSGGGSLLGSLLPRFSAASRAPSGRLRCRPWGHDRGDDSRTKRLRVVVPAPHSAVARGAGPLSACSEMLPTRWCGRRGPAVWWPGRSQRVALPVALKSERIWPTGTVRARADPWQGALIWSGGEVCATQEGLGKRPFAAMDLATQRAASTRPLGRRGIFFSFWITRAALARG